MSSFCMVFVSIKENVAAGRLCQTYIDIVNCSTIVLATVGLEKIKHEKGVGKG